MMYKKILSYLLVLSCILVSGCGDILSPANENINGLEDAYENPAYAEGLLADAYNLLPTNGYTFSDVATDNAVSNDNSNAYRQMATGQWTANNYPLNQWRSSQAAIQYLNIFLSVSDNVLWAEDEEVNQLFNQRMKGEAYGLRAVFMYHLLRAHAGWTGSEMSGELLGIPIVLEPQDKDSELNRPRNTFEESMQQLYSDIEQATQLLPADFGEVGDDSQLPDNYSDVNSNNYNRVFGEYALQRMSGRIAMAIKTKAALMAASPAYNSSDNTTTWEDAANFSGNLLALNNGLAGFADEGATWYDNDSQISNLGSGANPPEIIWRTNVAQNSTLEQEHFPPTLFGNGRINPTQNLVDAFPMQNGYPIDDANSGYDSSDPYTGRIPLLQQYVLVNGGTAGVNSTTITTAADGNTNDALNAVETSTRTGYYLKKLLRQNVNLDPTSSNTQLHYTPRLRYTEIYLAYAEAANEAWGPMGTGSFGFSAYDVISAIRGREGIAQPDSYLQSVSGNQDAMRDLIRNTRRIELAFENARFWDLRRWDMDLTQPARGDRIQNGTHSIFSVEERDYESYMNFGPVPYNEILKFGELQQNYGW